MNKTLEDHDYEKRSKIYSIKSERMRKKNSDVSAAHLEFFKYG